MGAEAIQITLGDDSQCTDIIVYLTKTDLGDDSQCTRGKAVQLHIKYLSRQIEPNNLGPVLGNLRSVKSSPYN